MASPPLDRRKTREIFSIADRGPVRIAKITRTFGDSPKRKFCQATALFERLTKLSSQPKLDDDRASRLRLIWNRSKHFDEDLKNPNKTDAHITAPVWLTNHGISSTPASVTFDELHSILSDLLKIFKTLSG